MLSHVDAQIRLPSGTGRSRSAPDDRRAPPMARRRIRRAMSLVEFRLELGLPIWRYEGDGFVIEKRVLMPYRQNTVHLTYRLLAGPSAVRLELRPFMHVRHYESPLSEVLPNPYILTAVERPVRSVCRAPSCRRSVCCSLRSAAGAHASRARSCATATSKSSRAATNTRARCGAPAISRSISGADPAGRPRRSWLPPKPWETVTALTPDAAIPRPRRRGARGCSNRHPSGCAPACRPNWSSPPINFSSRRPPAPRMRRAPWPWAPKRGR